MPLRYHNLIVTAFHAYVYPTWLSYMVTTLMAVEKTLLSFMLQMKHLTVLSEGTFRREHIYMNKII